MFRIIKERIKIKSQNTTVLFSLIRSQNIMMSQPKKTNTFTHTSFHCPSKPLAIEERLFAAV